MSESILFVCTGNACRSPMAEGFGRYGLPDSYDVYSAGARPIGVDERAIRVMDEIGIDLRDQTSSSIEDVPVKPELVIVMSRPAARRVEDLLPKEVTRERWKIRDPYGASGTLEEQLETFRGVRLSIKQKMSEKWPGLFLGNSPIDGD